MEDIPVLTLTHLHHSQQGEKKSASKSTAEELLSVMEAIGTNRNVSEHTHGIIYKAK